MPDEDNREKFGHAPISWDSERSVSAMEISEADFSNVRKEMVGFT